MFRSLLEIDLASSLMNRLFPHLVVNIGDESNYEVRRSALLVVKEVSQSGIGSLYECNLKLRK